jgi:uncharacterized protein YodC (DUF2158 family)
MTDDLNQPASTAAAPYTGTIYPPTPGNMIEVGAVVALKSAPYARMTVERIEGGAADCVWFAGSEVAGWGELCHATVQLTVLRLAP